MSRLHTNWSRSLLREKPAAQTTKQEEGKKKVLIPTSGLDVLKKLVVAKKVPVEISGLFYTFSEGKDGKRILQRFYSRGAQLPFGDELRDIVFDIEPKFLEGHIVPFEKGHQGDLILEVPGTKNAIKYDYVYPDFPETSPIRATFVITPDFVSFDGQKSVNPDVKEEDKSEDDESEDEEG